LAIPLLVISLPGLALLSMVFFKPIVLFGTGVFVVALCWGIILMLRFSLERKRNGREPHP
jgi:hypothetical protein